MNSDQLREHGLSEGELARIDLKLHEKTLSLSEAHEWASKLLQIVRDSCSGCDTARDSVERMRRKRDDLQDELERTERLYGDACTERDKLKKQAAKDEERIIKLRDALERIESSTDIDDNLVAIALNALCDDNSLKRSAA